jgi:hypothetical protein
MEYVYTKKQHRIARCFRANNSQSTFRTSVVKSMT